jgi:hypothetical protein
VQIALIADDGLNRNGKEKEEPEKQHQGTRGTETHEQIREFRRKTKERENGWVADEAQKGKKRWRNRE